VGITAFVFDERAALGHADYRDWIRREIETARETAWDEPESSSARLRKWFDEMRSSFPLIGDAHPDDPFGTEYCFFRNVIDVGFASSVGEKGVLQAWRLAEKHGLRLLVGDELLPPTAPQGKRDVHISVLDGRRPDSPEVAPNVCLDCVSRRTRNSEGRFEIVLFYHRCPDDPALQNRLSNASDI
jgi:hypothetical protein